MLAFDEPEILGNRMEEWEYCLLWASPGKTIVVKPGGSVETYSNHGLSRSSEGILASLQADRWETAAFNMTPTDDMTYLFKRRVQSQRLEAGLEHTPTHIPIPTPRQPPVSPPL